MVIFGTGVVTGGLLVRHASPVQPNQQAAVAPRPAQPTSAGGMRLELLRRMERELDLSPRQRSQVDKLIKESQERTRKIMEPIAPEITAQLQRAKDEFRAVLTPAQQARFDQLIKQQRPREKSRSGSPRDHGPEGSNVPSPSGVIERN